MSEDPDPAARTDGTGLSLDEVRHRARRMAWGYLLAAAALIPWTVYLALTLPRRDVTAHYRMAWVGFDLLLVATIVLTAYFAFRVDPRVQLPATATATPRASAHDAVDASHHVVVEQRHDLEGRQVLVDLLHPAGPGDHGRHVGVLDAPGDRQLGE